MFKRGLLVLGISLMMVLGMSTNAFGIDPSNYVIITTNAIKSASTQLQNFIDFKKLQEYSVTVVTEDNWGGGTGDVAAENIRAWLKSKYLTHEIKYVLLIGNPDPDNGDVPMKKCWLEGYDGNNEISTDFYYSELTGNWDLNADGWYGDYWNDYGMGGFDNVGEVAVGRIPYYGSISDLDSILAKTINYENTPAAEIGWRSNALLAMKSQYNYSNSYDLGERIKGDILAPNNVTYYRVYDDTYGLNPAPDVHCAI